MAPPANLEGSGGSPNGLLEGTHAKIFLASKSTMEDRYPLFDSSLPVEELMQLSACFRDGFDVVTKSSGASCRASDGRLQDGGELFSGPAEAIQTTTSSFSITVVDDDVLTDKPFKVVLCLLIEIWTSGNAEDNPQKLSLNDLLHCLGFIERLGVPMTLKDQLCDRLAKMTDDRIPPDDVKVLCSHVSRNHPAFSVVIESTGEAGREEHLRQAHGYYDSSREEWHFSQDPQQPLHKNRVDGSVGGVGLISNTEASVDANSHVGNKDVEFDSSPGAANNMTSRLPTTVKTTTVPNCGAEGFKCLGPAFISRPIMSFDGPADKWSNIPATNHDSWNTPTEDWKDSSTPSGGYGDGWSTTGEANTGGWGDSSGAAAGAHGDDDNTCRRCKKPGHFARECDLPCDNTCFNCGQVGHMSRECIEPKKPRGGDRTCHKCNEVGHIARDCLAGGGDAGDRACHKCGEGGHFARECNMPRDDNCFNCGQAGHMSRECTEPKKPRGGDHPCHQCGESGHFARECTSSAFGAAAGGSGEDSVDPARDETVTVTVPAIRVRKGKKGRPGYLDITQQMYDPYAYERARHDSNGGGQRREGGGRGGRGGRGRGGSGGRRTGGNEGHHRGDAELANENVPPPEPTHVPIVAVEGDWADIGPDDGVAAPIPGASGW